MNNNSIELIRKQIPEMKIFGSVILEVDYLTRLEKIASMGVEHICFSKTLFKNFIALRNIERYSKIKNVKAVLSANDPCLHHCTLTFYHNNILSHQTGDGIEAPSYCRLHCTREFLRTPHRYISASFIRPEDLKVYDDMGYKFFKLCDRKQTTEWIKRVLKHTLPQGNLLKNAACFIQTAISNGARGMHLRKWVPPL